MKHREKKRSSDLDWIRVRLGLRLAVRGRGEEVGVRG
jgi:hypothetical protein